MKKRYRQQQMVESDRAPYPSVRSPQRQEVSSVKLSLIIGIVILGLLILGGAVLGILSLADVIRGHPGESWRHFISWWEAIRWWLLAGVGGVVALHIQKERSRTAVERAEAKRIREEARQTREETRRMRDIRSHNEEHMPKGYIPLPDELGNYPQLVYPDRSVTYLFPANAPAGNAGINPKHLMDFMERMRNVVDADDYEEEEEDLQQLLPPLKSGRELIEDGTVQAALSRGEIILGYDEMHALKMMKVVKFFGCVARKKKKTR